MGKHSISGPRVKDKGKNIIEKSDPVMEAINRTPEDSFVEEKEVAVVQQVEAPKSDNLYIPPAMIPSTETPIVLDEWVQIADWRKIPKGKEVQVTIRGIVVENNVRMSGTKGFLLIRTSSGPKQVFPADEFAEIKIKR